MANTLFAVVYPTPCSLCHKELVEATRIDICRQCWAELQPWAGAACSHCGLPFASEHALDSSIVLCPECRTGQSDFDVARSYALYGGKLRSAILQLKFRRRERLGKRLGELLAFTWEALGLFAEHPPPVIIPVPLHQARKRERGFNQAELLARGLSRKIAKTRGTPGPRVETHCVDRARPTLPQTGLSIPQRKENVHGVFAVTKPGHTLGRVVVLVDDVMTTGATLSACAGALQKAGALRVLGLTLARATPQFPDLGSAQVGRTIDDFGHPWT